MTQSTMLTWLPLLLTVAACGGDTSPGPDGSGGAPSGGAGGAGGSGGGSSGSGCPASPPTAGSDCTAPWTTANPFPGGVAAHCSWGDDPRAICRTTGVCGDDGKWSITAGACPDPPLPAACPETPPSATTQCDSANLSCLYTDGTHCHCSECRGGSEYPICQPISPAEWACTPPRDGCPVIAPTAGSPCDTPGASCGPSCELEITCEGGIWQWRHGMCPICAAPNTPIATPEGNRPIADLRPGDLVYSEHLGAMMAVPVLRVASTPVSQHQVVRLALASGEVLELSPGHPTRSGVPVGTLLGGDWLDPTHRVLDAELVPYRYDRTYDILPDSSTGAYVAGGALLGSSLTPAATPMDGVSSTRTDR